MPQHVNRHRHTKIVSTLGPVSSSPEMIERLFTAGVDVFRLNFSHGSHEDHAARIQTLRALEEKTGRPICILADLQGPKLRVGKFTDGGSVLTAGQSFRFDRQDIPGDATRAYLPHPEIFAALKVGATLLIDDGKLRVRVTNMGQDFAETEVIIGGKISDRKGVNVPDVILPLPALTEKDRKDLDFALSHGADWIALSFVQKPEDLTEVRAIVGTRAALLSKLEKPSAIQQLDEIIALSDGVMVARGDLGVEMPAEDVPAIQKKIIRIARSLGKPVIVATQMLESMITSPTPTRAEASDVATAVYDGADAVMLSAETASGAYPIEAVQMMDRIAARTESDASYRTLMDSQRPMLLATGADAMTAAAHQVAHTIRAAAIATYTTSGLTALRESRERPAVPILCLTSSLETARRLVLAYGTHPVHTPDVGSLKEMVEKAQGIAAGDGLAKSGDTIVITAGFPFGRAGNTNTLHVAEVGG